MNKALKDFGKILIKSMAGLLIFYLVAFLSPDTSSFLVASCTVLISMILTVTLCYLLEPKEIKK